MKFSNYIKWDLIRKEATVAPESVSKREYIHISL